MKTQLKSGRALLCALILMGFGLSNAAHAAPFLVTTTADNGAGSLRQAIADANADATNDDITFDAAAFNSAQTISLASALPNLTQPVTITGPGANLLRVRATTQGAFTIFTVYSGVSVTLSGLTISNGNGGIYNLGTVIVTGCTLSSNTNGIDNYGTLAVTGCTLSGNTTGIRNIDQGNFAGVTATNCTLSGNTTGISNSGIRGGGPLSITGCTVSGNTNTGIAISAGGGATLKNTLVAGNPTNVQGSFTNGGNSITSGTAADAGLDPAGLQDNGGPTQTIALLSTSPAVNAGNNSLIPSGISTDQRGTGFPRIAIARVDIGAYELPDTAQSTPNFVVNSATDTDDGVCGASDCTLRDAINAANSKAGDDTITFDATVFAAAQTITLGGTQLPDITSNIAINGPAAGVTISGNNASRVFLINSGTVVSLDKLIITNGNESASDGGGIVNLGTLTITSSTLSGNTASGLGGGIYNFGTLTLTGSTLSGNSTRRGGGIDNDGTLTLTNSTLSGNTASVSGGGINNSGTLTITGSTLSGNTASNFGGGIVNSDTLTVTNSTLSGNSVSGNISGFDGGGGINTRVGGSVTLDSCTLTNNSAPNVVAGTLSGIWLQGGTLTVRNTIVAGNGAGDVQRDGGTLASNGYNLIGVTNVAASFNGSGDQIGVANAKLGPLANNGGPTQTHALLAGSPAINAGDTTLTTDQRGIARPQANRDDIGAFELEASNFTESLVVTTTTDEDNGTSDPAFGSGTSLREAINYANSNAEDDTITFAAGVTGTITLTSELPGLSTNIDLQGPGANVLMVARSSAEGTPQFRIFTVYSGTVSLSGLTLSNGNVGNGGGIEIFSGSTVSVTNCTISNNTSTSPAGGGGIYTRGTLTLTNCTISNNSADGSAGGGILISTGTVNVINSTIAHNSASYAGGGIYSFSKSGIQLTVTNSTIAFNASPNGGGIYNAGTLTLNNSILAKNAPSELSGSMDAGDYNLVENTAGSTLTGTHNITGQDPLLGPLQDNGGPTQTMALYYRSPAIDKGNRFGATTDQRGLTRPFNDPAIAPADGGDDSDIGAVEAQVVLQSTSETLVVTTAADEDNGTIDPAVGTGTSLREAINYANSKGKAGDDTITFDATVFAIAKTISLGGTQLPTIAVNIAINGPAARVTISGNNVSRVFEILTSTVVSLDKLTISKGSASDGGGIDNAGTLTITGSTLSANSAGQYGGGVYNNGGTLTITGSTISGNTSDFGSIYNDGGTLTITGSTISGNSAGLSGGGINNGGGMTITGSTISGNSSNLDGGGIYNAGGMTITGSTISGNSAAAAGGGIANRFGNWTITNSTLSGNTATSERVDGGGGIWHFDGDAILDSCTITNNSSPDIAGGTRSGLWMERYGALMLRNTIVAGNGAGDIQRDGGTLTSSGYNLIGITNVAASFSGPSDQTGVVDAKLSPLADHGGPTQTHALLSGSPAIDQGNSFGLTTDQRGALHPKDHSSIANAAGGDGSDIGAFEQHDITAPTVIISEPLHNHTYTTSPAQAAGTVSDASALSKVTLRLYRYATRGNSVGFWDGSTAKPVFDSVYNEAAHEQTVTTVDGYANWSLLFPTLSPGEYQVRVLATDVAGQVGVAAHRFIINDASPQVVITKPTNGGTHLTSALAQAEGTASDSDGIVEVKVRLYRYATNGNTAGFWNGSTAAPAYGSPAVTVSAATANSYANWTVSLPSLNGGRYYLSATARDSAGNWSEKLHTFFVNDTSPQVVISTPSHGLSYLASALSQAEGTATDSDGVTQVQVRLYRYATNGNTAGFWNGSTASPVYNSVYSAATHEHTAATSDAFAHWMQSLPTLVVGKYSVRATGRDAAGNTNTKLSVFYVKAANSVVHLPAVHLPAAAKTSTKSSVSSTQAKAQATVKAEVTGTATASASANSIRLEFSDAVPAGEFVVTVNGAEVEVQTVLRDKGSVTLLLPDGALQTGDQVQVSWQNAKAQTLAQ